jgi:glycolate oxidase FAD binding subunit
MQHHIQSLQYTIKQAAPKATAQQRKLQVVGGGSKHFYGQPMVSDTQPAYPLSVAQLSGIVDYAPSELVMTAFAGTTLEKIHATLAVEKQCLGFEPPAYVWSGDKLATLGGAVATGLSGIGRPFQGSVRDATLGLHMVDGRGEYLKFGGQVIKNVAGFDVSRLMVGSRGTLGVLAQISIKVMPMPEVTETLVFDINHALSIETMNRWQSQSLPISAMVSVGERFYVRLSGLAPAVSFAKQKLGGELMQFDKANQFWRGINNHSHPFFTPPSDTHGLWRLSVASHTPNIQLDEAVCIDWGGAQRWLWSTKTGDEIRSVACGKNEHATLFVKPSEFNAANHGAVFHPVAPANAIVQQRLKKVFDPYSVFPSL